jgi:hypothetical protein
LGVLQWGDLLSATHAALSAAQLQWDFPQAWEDACFFYFSDMTTTVLIRSIRLAYSPIPMLGSFPLLTTKLGM